MTRQNGLDGVGLSALVHGKDEPVAVAGAARGEPLDASVPGALTRPAIAFHALTLAVAATVLVWTARGVQFYWDDWALVAALSRGDLSLGWLLANHNEHWILLPKLVYAGLFAVVGFDSVWPFMTVTVLLHLLLCHLMWRMAIRAGADAWLTGVACMGFALYAAGIENILFSIQMALIGSMVLGALTVLELRRPSPRRMVVVMLTTLNVMMFGLAPVFLVLAAMMLLMQRRARLLWTLVPATAVFATWYVAQSPSVTGQARSTNDLGLIPLYWLLGVGNAVSSIIPWRSPEDAILPGLDPESALLALAGVCLILGALWMAARYPFLRPDTAVTIFALGLPTLVVVTSFSRVSYGLGYAMLSRYTYVGTAFIFPLLVVLVSRMAGGSGRRWTAAVAGVTLIAVLNVVAWPTVANAWTAKTCERARVLAAGQQLARLHQPLLPQMAATQEFGFLAADDLPRLNLSSVASQVTRADQLSAVLATQVALVPADHAEQACGDPQADLRVRLDSQPSTPTTVQVLKDVPVALSLLDESGRSHVRLTRMTAGLYSIRSLVSEGDLAMTIPNGLPLLRQCH